MALKPPLSVHLEFTSAFEMLDVTQMVSDHICKEVGLDEDAVHWVSVAVRESVANAIKHLQPDFCVVETAAGADQSAVVARGLEPIACGRFVRAHGVQQIALRDRLQ